MKSEFLTPVVTILDENGRIDEKGNCAVYDHLIAGGVDGIVVMGSTGEFFALPMEEKKKLASLAVRHIAGRTRVLIGTGCMTVEETVELSNFAHGEGADGVMIVSPYYFSLSEASILEFYDRVAGAVSADIYIYNFPDRTGYDVSPAITLQLARRHKNIVGYKDTVNQLGHTRALIETMRPEFPDFVIYSGYDENLAHVALAGGDGCIGGLSNLAPRLCADFSAAIRREDFAACAQLQKKIDGLMELYDIGTPFIPIMKRAMQLAGLPISDRCTPPFLTATPEQEARIRQVMERAGLLG